MELYGRKVIETDFDFVDEENIAEIIKDAFTTHDSNRAKISYLYNYYRGKQEIRNRVKTFRNEICNKITENRAYEIVNFKTGYLVGEPVQYVSARAEATDRVLRLNEYMEYNSKTTKDSELVEWDMICGTGYMIALPNSKTDEVAECPFELQVLDPRNTFVVYTSGISHEALVGVNYFIDKNNHKHIIAYTKDAIFSFLDEKFLGYERNPVGRIPIVEYPANNSRLGAFEVCIDLLNAISTIDSNRLDGLEQFVQSLLVLYNCEVDEGTTAESIRRAGMMILRNTGENKADIKVISEALDQQQTQTLKQDLYSAVLTICSMPNRNGGGSTSDNGVAVVYRDGWSAAETSAKGSEAMYKKSDRELRRVIGAIANNVAGLGISVSDAVCKFTRRSYENIETKATVLTQLLNNDKVAPKYAYSSCGLFVDSEEAYNEGMKWYEENKEVAVSETENATEEADTPEVANTNDTADI